MIGGNGMKKKNAICDENCFECKFADCIVGTSVKERERQRLYYQKHKEEKKAYYKSYYQKKKGEIESAE